MLAFAYVPNENQPYMYNLISQLDNVRIELGLLA